MNSGVLINISQLGYGDGITFANFHDKYFSRGHFQAANIASLNAKFGQKVIHSSGIGSACGLFLFFIF